MDRFTKAILGKQAPPRKRHVYNDITTENAMPTHSESGSYLLDMFYSMGASRGKPDHELWDMVSKAWSDDKTLALRAMFYNRDCRGGQGERETFQSFFKWLSLNHPAVAINMLDFIPEYGRWDDMFSAFGTDVERFALGRIADALRRGDGLCAKWMPREGKKGYREYGDKVRTFIGLSKRNYRKLLAELTRVVETQMCKNQWSEIKYEHVPSVAHNKYRSAFGRHDFIRYGKYIKDVLSGKKKINAGVVFPHDIVRSILNNPYTNRDAVQAQWANLPDYVPEGESFIPVCDTSGSMWGTPMEVCVALGIYLSERNKGIFKDGFITFSANPVLQLLEGDLVKRVNSLKTAQWNMNTDLEKVFRLVLDIALQHGLDDSELPKNILILSDMQFDRAVHNSGDNVYQMARRMYEEAGYTLPNLIFWNLRDSFGKPVKYNQQGTAMVSGFSPSIMKNLLSGEISPMKVMLKTLNSPRYSQIRIG